MQIYSLYEFDVWKEIHCENVFNLIDIYQHVILIY